MLARWVFVLGMVSAIGARALAEPPPLPTPPLRIEPGKPLRMRGEQTAVLGKLTARLTTVHHGFSRDPAGRELYPFTEFFLTWTDGSGKEQARSVSPWTGKYQADLFGQYTFTVGKSPTNAEDEITLTVFAHSCVLRYTSSNQLQHKNGKIIFPEEEDPCCAYSDSKNTCDYNAKRAQPPRKAGPYCTLYSNQLKTANDPESACCCRYEAGEALEAVCAANCARLQR